MKTSILLLVAFFLALGTALHLQEEEEQQINDPLELSIDFTINLELFKPPITAGSDYLFTDVKFGQETK